MGVQLFKNNAVGTLNGSIAIGGTTLNLGAGQGSKFPTPTGGDYFLVTLYEKNGSGDEINYEVVACTARVADALTITRDYEGLVVAAGGTSGGWAYPSAVGINPSGVVYVEMRATAYAFGNAVTKDTKDTSGGYAGLTLYKVNMKNVANTFTSFLTNTNTAARTYTFQDRDGTLADLGANTFTGAQIYSDQVLSRGMTKDMGLVFLDKGNSGTSAQTIDYTAGTHQKLTVTGAFTMNAVTNWPPSGNTGEVLLELTNGASSVISWTMSGTTQNWVKSDGTFVATPALAGVTFQTSGTDFVLMWSRDGGTTTFIKVMR